VSDAPHASSGAAPARYRAPVQLRDVGRLVTGAHLTAGLATVGFAGYLYVAVIGRLFPGPEGARQISALVAVYLLVNIIGPGVFAALEQETSRAVSEALVTGGDARAAARRAAVLAAQACGIVAVVLLAAWPLVLSAVFDGRIGILLALLVAVVGSAAVYAARGVLGGQQRFRAYAVTFWVEGSLRLVPLLVLVVAGVAQPMLLAFVYCTTPLLAAIAVAPMLRIPATLDAGPGPRPRMGRSFGFLVTATALSQTIANLGPVVVTYRLPGDANTTSVFGSAFVLARVPLFLFAPILAVLLPALTRQARSHRIFARTLGRTVALLLAVGSAGVLVTALAGPWLVRFLFNTVRSPDAVDLTLLSAATVFLMLALVLQSALVALQRHAAVAAGWVVGGAVFLALLAGPWPPVVAAVAAQIAGPAVVTGWLAWQVRRSSKGDQGGTADRDGRAVRATTPPAR
jgi:O-antigen/teichoic acid export membrane protein